jgi:hypothetical protein
MKVTFTDNSETQYDDSADRIKYKGGKDTGKLYLGDRDSAAFLQLKYRECTSVVNCCVDTHGLAQDAKVKYCKCDPDEDSYVSSALCYVRRSSMRRGAVRCGAVRCGVVCQGAVHEKALGCATQCSSVQCGALRFWCSVGR